MLHGMEKSLLVASMTFAELRAAKMYGSYCWPSLSSSVMREKKTFSPCAVRWSYMSCARMESFVREPPSVVSL